MPPDAQGMVTLPYKDLREVLAWGRRQQAAADAFFAIVEEND